MLEVRLEIAERRVAEIRARNQLVQELTRKALHDPLTDLPNRGALEVHLSRAITVAANTGARLALLILDLDEFKRVNDTLGHARGDLLLKEVAARLRAILRASDTVARLGGDEFVFLLRDTDLAGAITVASRIMNAFTAPFIVEDQTLRVQTSIGIAVYPTDGREAEALIRGADAAMYRAKGSGAGVAVNVK
jgi:diguanylate cyclase (GGDEF)-like protein